MNVGWIGLGRLGLPCALVLDAAGHTVTGYDLSPVPAEILTGKCPPMQEEHITGLLASSSLKLLSSPRDVAATSDVVFVAVQTPHAPAYGGEVPAPEDRRDFEYAYLVQACRDVCAAAAAMAKPVTLVVVSTVLPGTVNRLIRPLLNPHVRLIYSPAFIAMGTTISDYRNPEFVTCGVDRDEDAEPLRDVFGAVHTRPLFVTSIETAELIKVFYNCFISTKIVLGNTLMEIAHKTGADCDAVIDALTLATDRIISPKYLRGGMGDGGGCHPRDNIAMSWLAERLDLSYDLMGEVTRAREAQTWWLADLARSYADQSGLPITILGKAYKPGSDLTAGSPALLLAHQLRDREPAHWDPHVEPRSASPLQRPAVFVVATRHPAFSKACYPEGSIVVDPFGYVPDHSHITVIRVGRKS